MLSLERSISCNKVSAREGDSATIHSLPYRRPHYHEHYYAAFLRDPAGNRIEAVCHAAPAPP